MGNSVLHLAVAGTGVTVETLRAALADDDVAEIAHGRLGAARGQGVRVRAWMLGRWNRPRPSSAPPAPTTGGTSSTRTGLGTCAAGVIPGWRG
ncbi:MAG: hypothetical protein U5L11_11725 [Arhodomonas sp.]|nr:hypothetical protein [Arhodomonas sp.]